MKHVGSLLVDVLLGVAVASGALLAALLLLVQAQRHETGLVQLRELRSQSRARAFAWQQQYDIFAAPRGGWRVGDALVLMSPCEGIFTVQSTAAQLTDTFATVQTDAAEAARLGSDCSPFALPDSGTTLVPQLASTVFLGSRIAAHGVDCVERDGATYAFVAATSTQVADPDLFVVDVTNPTAPYVVATLDAGAGFFTVDAYDQTVLVGKDSGVAQVAAIDVHDVRHPAIVAEQTLPGATGSYPEARSLVSYAGSIYVGTYETAGPELHLLDMPDAATLRSRASIALNHSIRSFLPVRILVDGVSRTLLYVASSGDAQEILVYDVTDLPHPVLVTSLDLPGTGNATALARSGTELLVGRQQAVGQPSIVTVDIRDPVHPLVRGGSASLTRSGSVVNGLLFSNNRVILTTTDANKPVFSCGYVFPNVTDCTAMGGYPDPGRIDMCNGVVFVPTQHALASSTFEKP